MRSIVLAITFLAACGDDVQVSADLGTSEDLAYTSACLNLGGTSMVACNEAPGAECSPQFGGELLCFCASPAKMWNCCHPEVYQCPTEMHTGDFCCPSAFSWGPRTCGSCTCINAQFVCDSDGGTHD